MSKGSISKIEEQKNPLTCFTIKDQDLEISSFLKPTFNDIFKFGTHVMLSENLTRNRNPVGLGVSG